MYILIGSVVLESPLAILSFNYSKAAHFSMWLPLLGCDSS